MNNSYTVKDNITVIGLTGQSGAGKTTVCDTFEEEGFGVINADEVARAVTQKGSKCCEVLKIEFPQFFSNGELDRAVTAKAVFNDKKLLERYTAIIYPFITEIIVDEIRKYASGGKEFVLLDAPTLFESGSDKLCDLIVSVIADEQIRAKRIAQRDKIDEEMIKSRFSSQKNDDFYISRSDYVIYNNDTQESLISKAKETALRIKERDNGKKEN